jgi:hypothetical protein
LPSKTDRLDAEQLLPTDVHIVQAGSAQRQRRPEIDVLGFFAKFGLIVRSGAEVRITSTDLSPVSAQLEYTILESAQPVDVLEVQGCGPHNSDWLVFAGGIWISSPACVELTVEADGRKSDARLAVGAPCES